MCECVVCVLCVPILTPPLVFIGGSHHPLAREMSQTAIGDRPHHAMCHLRGGGARGPSALGQPKAGRPTRSPDLVVAAHGPHRLSDDTWRGAIGPPWRFGSVLWRMAGGSPLYI